MDRGENSYRRGVGIYLNALLRRGVTGGHV